MDYRRYTTEDFVLDEQFQDWVFRSTPSLTSFWENFLRQYPEKAPEVEAAKHQLRTIRFRQHASDDLMHRRIRTKLVNVTASNRQIERKTYHRRLLPYLAAACLALLVLVGIGVWQNYYQLRPTYQTAYAETKEVWLPDSTWVVLNANSSLTIGDYSDGPLREVWLAGEAFFEVKENPAQPFVVHTEAMNVRVTGTSFNVADRPKKTEVVLATGQVLLEADALADPLRMQPGDLVAYNKASRQIEQQKVLPDQYTAWRDRIYFFQEASLPEVAEVIETYYGQKVHLAPGLSELKFTAKVVMQPEVDALLTLLSETFDLSITRNQQQVMMKKNSKP